MYKKKIAIILLSVYVFVSCDARNLGKFVINSKLPEKCGWLPNYSPEYEYVSRTNWPWVGTLSYESFDLKKCIPILIHPEVILTASLCIENRESHFHEELKVEFSMRGLQTYRNITIDKISFSDDDIDGIALLKLKHPVVINAAVHPICLWEENHDYSTQILSHTALMTGSDLTENNGDSTILQLPVQISDTSNCKENKMLENDICVTYGKELQVCHYIGSAMIFPRLSYNGTIIWHLRGILTRRLNNCGKNHYRVKDLASQRNWIESHFKASIESRCGRRVIDHIPLIINGERTERGDFPWHLALYVYPDNETSDKNKSRPVYYGGATLISEKFAITAGHCIKTDSSNFTPERIILAMGKFNLLTEEQGTQFAKISKIIMHENYNFTTLQNDIALLKFIKSVIFSNYIQPICMWDDTNTDKKLIFEKKGKVVGWGKNENGNISETLTSASVQIQSDNECRRSDGDFYKIYLTDTTLCAGNPENRGINVCNGDSGGGLILPILQGDRHVSWYLRGIVSVSKSKQDEKICDTKYSVIYTDVAQYIKWINKKIKDNS